MKNEIKYSKVQTVVLVLLRLIVGYHFLFEGVDKLFSPNWTAAGFLLQSNWWFSGVFQFIAESPLLLGAVDLINVWGQIFIGLSLIVGLFSTTAALFGALMLFTYYIAIPPFIDSYIFIDKNLLELFAFLIIALFPTSYSIGIDMLVNKYRNKSNG